MNRQTQMKLIACTSTGPDRMSMLQPPMPILPDHRVKLACRLELAAFENAVA